MQDFLQNGYAIVPNAIAPQTIRDLIQEINKHITDNNSRGTRNIAKKILAIASLANSPVIKNLLLTTTQKHPQLVRSIYFNKTQNSNWFVGWHQDKVIALKEKILTPGYINWTVKQGVPHVQPPLKIMENIITLRLHLDKTNNENGALKVIPQSHKLGFLNSKQISRLTRDRKFITCSANPGDILMMSPLILHSSTKSKNSRDRRIIHLEYSVTSLPPHLKWNNDS